MIRFTLFIIGLALVIEAAVASVIAIVTGVACGPICGAVVGVAVVTALSIITLGLFWLHTAPDGSVNFVIPNYTMLQPFGGNVLWADSGLWDYMPNQCWIVEDNQSYRGPDC